MNIDQHPQEASDSQEDPQAREKRETAIPDKVDPEPSIEPQEERLVHLFERLFIRQEVSSGQSLTSEQITLAIQVQEDDRKRFHERMMLKEKLRHEIALARQEQQFELKKAKTTFFPKVAFCSGVAILAGTALIIYLLVAYGAKDQLGVVLAFLTGIAGGFGGGFATAKYGGTERAKRPS
jgi:hypothetical protein